MSDGTKLIPIAWIWCRTIKSPDPSWPGHVPLVGSWELSRKNGKPTVWIEPLIDQETKKISFKVREGGVAPKGIVNRNGATCIATGATMSLAHIREEGKAGKLGVQLMAIVCEGKNGRVYTEVDDTDTPILEIEKLDLGPISLNTRDFRTGLYLSLIHI